MDLEGRTVVVTGGTGALGTAVVARLLQDGARCLVPFLEQSEADNSPHAGHAKLSLTGPVDLASERDVVGYYAGLGDLWASVHLAGGFAMAPLAETSADEFVRQFEMNALSCFLCCREAVKAIRRGPGHGGRIVNIAARPALEPRGGAGMAAYTASKAAVAALTAALGEELAGEGIWVNAVAPSIIDTPANRAAMPDADHAQWPSPEEIAATIAYFVSDDCRVARGAVAPVYGRV